MKLLLAHHSAAVCGDVMLKAQGVQLKDPDSLSYSALILLQATHFKIIQPVQIFCLYSYLVMHLLMLWLD